ncbi:hypothetical protein [Rhodococcus zopfii]|uniref:hypothetical protein n=1 Tax=Rhodococcus zopfii TaxID=43772 RepID=UPI00352943AC
MTRSRESSSHGGSGTGLVHPLKESTNLGGALHVVGQGALALAQGSSSAALCVARRSVDLAKSVASRARRASSPTNVVALVQPVDTRTGRGRKALIMAGTVGAVVAGGVVFFRVRRFEHPPVAPEPPRVDQVPRVADQVPPVSGGTD